MASGTGAYTCEPTRRQVKPSKVLSTGPRQYSAARRGGAPSKRARKAGSYSVASLLMLPGDISSDSPVVAASPRYSVQNCPETRGKNRKQASARGIDIASARADSRTAARVLSALPGCAMSANATQAPQITTR
jgi:hypothetical protein